MLRINEKERLVEIENIEKKKGSLLQGFNAEEGFYYKLIIEDEQIKARFLLDKENCEKVFHFLNLKNEESRNQKLLFRYHSLVLKEIRGVNQCIKD